MRTNIPERKLVELRALGIQSVGAFVDPQVIASCSNVLARRGDEWAASVLGHDITRRSTYVTNRPYLRDGEEYTLVLADAEEDTVTLREAGHDR
jgi:hypothetical protein